MAIMAAFVPATSFSTASSTSEPSSSTFHHTLPSQHFKSSRRISASSRCNRHGHGSADVFSGATVSCQGVPVRSDSASASEKLKERSLYQLERSSKKSYIEFSTVLRNYGCVVTVWSFFSRGYIESSADEICSSIASDLRCTGSAQWLTYCGELPSGSISRHGHTRTMRNVFRCNCASHENQDTAGNEDSTEDVDKDSPSGGVAIAVKVLQFYKREISPLLPGSCRFVPTCSEYGMQAFKKYGVVKGTILTAWRLSRCNPLGGSGFDPPRWFDEPRPPPY